MKIPKTLKVGGHTFKVEITKVRDEKKGSEYWGKTNFNHNTILLDSEITGTRLEETFLHEILHICLNQSGMEFKRDDDTKEEYLVNAVTAQLYTILKENRLI